MQAPNDSLLQEFLDRYVACVHISDIEKSAPVLQKYEHIIHCFEKECDEERILENFEELAKMKISLGIPYIALSNEIAGMKNMFIKKGISHIDLARLLDLFYKIDNVVAKLYLEDYLKKLKHMNNMRLASLAEILDLDIIRFYKAHLLWLNDLIERIEKKETANFPELDHTLCEFGTWLHTEGKIFIQNNSKYKAIETMHKNLHLFARKIQRVLPQEEYYILISYLEKCELLSLNIGTELVLVDNIEINKKVTKDALTGALNRHALKPIFETQYELAFATGNGFVMALMDLDDFKHINDEYGHLCGDEMLREFVKCVKRNIRNSDVIVRYGGEEFVLFLPSIPIEKALEVLNRIKDEFASLKIEAGGKFVSTTVSMGVVPVEPKMPFVGSLGDEYLMIADKKLYEAKAEGKNRIVV